MDEQHPDPDGGWADVVDALTRLDRRPTEIIARRALNEAEHLFTTDRHPLERRRIAGLLARNALALYLLAGGDVDHFRRVVNLLAIVRDGDAVGTVAARGRIARRVVDAHSTSAPDWQQIADLRAALVSLEQPAPDQLAIDAALRYRLPGAVPDTDPDPDDSDDAALYLAGPAHPAGVVLHHTDHGPVTRAGA